MGGLTGKTRVLGIFGDPVTHSLSPAMQNAALRQAGIDAIYVPFHVTPEQLPRAVEGMRALRIWGVNVTIPHKEAICPLLDEVDADAALIGAVNTVVLRDGRLVGCNTDGDGLVASLQTDLQFDPRGRRILLLGAGGTSRSVAVALARAGAERITIANRTRSRARQLAADFTTVLPGTSFATIGLEGSELAVAVAECDLVVNSTSIGLQGEAFAGFPWQCLSAETRCYDIVYRRGGTPWLLRAERQGCRCADGLGMLAAQGELAFRIWTGQSPPSGVMKCRLLAEVATS
ncbi:shikimate dehydrogenase [Geothermobacter hydrogeniphilus]|uniref:shikimate dehydrogenase n=1 Tax=Geothermobacter hydrogeniphilus TaxID=1969733 RepID=UPI00111BD704|nr:shikimate dehydrogenase [Geothermobacter hydrogeniphilus]